ncbi:segregation and condensation protein A [Pleomorphomonas koreensis]|uniref:segregation and condensation protein A n=1 Tax=Pleomorphomonas koreensis TaxID=257440 RepID=UPI00040E5782|nr:ScpA family protein [Pleomorphomonas koreensis]
MVTTDEWSESRLDVDPTAGEAFVVDLDGFEGPLDLLLTLARNQKVDLARISILALADQYLAFIDKLGEHRLELAADYLVMAAWLAYLKSRLMLPPDEVPQDEPSAEELAGMLAMRLKRLEGIRILAGRLLDRSRLGRDVLPRGAPEETGLVKRSLWEASLYDLLDAYGRQRQRDMVRVHTVRKRQVWALADARDILERLVGTIADWAPIDDYLVRYMTGPDSRATVRASAFSAALELVREGRMELMQSSPFAPLYMRKGPGGPDTPEEGA